MALPDPKPGLVIRYDYLWRREQTAGRNLGKERPTCLVAASDAATSPRFVVLLPITHTPPDAETVGIKIPAEDRRRIGLDDAPSWIIVSEHNVDEWPNGGITSVPGRPDVFSYGFIPRALFAKVKGAFLDLASQKKSGGVRR